MTTNFFNIISPSTITILASTAIQTLGALTYGMLHNDKKLAFIPLINGFKLFGLNKLSDAIDEYLPDTGCKWGSSVGFSLLSTGINLGLAKLSMTLTAKRLSNGAPDRDTITDKDDTSKVGSLSSSGCDTFNITERDIYEHASWGPNTPNMNYKMAFIFSAIETVTLMLCRTFEEGFLIDKIQPLEINSIEAISLEIDTIDTSQTEL